LAHGRHPSVRSFIKVYIPDFEAAQLALIFLICECAKFDLHNDPRSHWYDSSQEKPIQPIDISIVLFKFRADVGDKVRQDFLTQIKTLKALSCVKSQRLVAGGPSITTPIEKSKGFQYALVSYHEDRAALAEYQASSEHER
jgi:hypothetical protein